MTQALPSTEYESKAVALILEMRSFIMDAQKNVNPEQANAKFRDIQTRFRTLMGKPMTQYEPYVKGEPARSDKLNRFFNSVQSDINILEEQVELIRSSAVYTHNNMNVELDKAKNENAQALNRMKSLQLYSSSQKNEIAIFGDYFKSDELFDIEKVKAEDRAVLSHEGQLTLRSISKSITNPFKNARITILSSSNGFPGRLVEVEELTPNAPISPSGKKLHRFKAQLDQRSSLDSIIDNSPATWFEYEKNLVNENDRKKALNYNFDYRVQKNEKINKNHDIEYPVSDGALINWANGLSGNILKLDFQVDMLSIKTINKLTYTPFDLEDYRNSPVLIRSVETSTDENTWTTLYPTNIIVSQDANLNSINAEGQVTLGAASWNLTKTDVRYIRFHIEQNKSMPTKIGHLYYETPKKIHTVVEYQSATPTLVKKPSGGERVSGPNPTTSSPTKFYDPSYSYSEGYVGGNTKNVEIFNGQRWAIGIRDISASEIEYSTLNTMISKEFRINGIIDRVSLEASSHVPESFSTDALWIKYYISPDNGKNWYQISRIQDDYLSVPEIIAFNDPIPNEFKEQNVGYYNVSGVVNSLRVKINISRPPSMKTLTPVVYWYKLKVRRR